MAVPDFQSLMLPLLRIVSGGQEHAHSQVVDALGAEFALTEEELSERLPSGRQTRFDNRVAWARSHLKQAGLLENTARGKFRITSRGQEVLQANPSAINIRFLMRFPEYAELRSRRGNRHDDDEVEENVEQTPVESLEANYQSLRRNLAQELLERVRQGSPKFFESLVIDLLVAMGYGGSRKDAGERVGQSGDGGIDGIIKEDKLGLDVVCIQAKRWGGTVGSPVVREFIGSLEGRRARKGVLITTSQFSQEAKDCVANIEKKIVLIDGDELAQLMIDYGIGVAEVSTYIVKRVDLDYFGEE